MRELKKKCHTLFDPMWQGKPKAQKKRNDLYFWLSRQMGIPREECHFGYIDTGRLKTALQILTDAQGKQMKYDNCGLIFFEEVHDG